MISPTVVVVSGLVLGLGTFAFRVAGPLLGSQVTLSRRTSDLMSTAAIVLLVAVCVTAAVTESDGFAGWARVLAVGVAGVLAWRGAPFVVVVVTAAALAAGLRLLGLVS